MGMTIEELTKIGGNQLDCIADLGTKKIYKFNGLKITVNAGKVTNVE